MTIHRKVKPVRAVERGLDVFLELQRRRGASLHELHLACRTDARLYPGSFSEWYSLGPVERD